MEGYDKCITNPNIPNRKYIKKVLEDNGFIPNTKCYFLWEEYLAAGLSQTEPLLQKHKVLCLYLAQRFNSTSQAIDANLMRWREKDGMVKQSYGNKQLYTTLIHEILEMEAMEKEFEKQPSEQQTL